MNQCACTRRTPNYVCNVCTAELSLKLSEVRSLLDDLDVTISRRDQVSPIGPKAKGQGENLPLNLTASYIKTALIEAVQGLWIASTAQRYAYTTDTVKLAKEARDGMAKFAGNPKAPLLHEHFLRVREEARNVIDLPDEKIRIGTCGNIIEGELCEEDLYAVKGEPWVHCKTCGHTWDVEEHRGRALDDAENVEAYPSVLVKVLHASGFAVTQKRFDKWVYNGQIIHSDVDGTGRKLYRLGDARALADRATTNTVKEIVTRRLGACSRNPWGVGWLYNHAKPIKRAA